MYLLHIKLKLKNMKYAWYLNESFIQQLKALEKKSFSGVVNIIFILFVFMIY